MALALWLAASTAHADAFYKLVGYECDRKADRLIVTYDAAANSEGAAMLEAKRENQWDPSGLVTMKDDDHIGALTTIRRNCKLSDGVYTIKLGPEPGNMNIQGHCGAWMSAWAEVRKGKQILYPRTDFENGVGCYYEDGVITTRIEISPHTRQPKLTIHPAVELLSGL